MRHLDRFVDLIDRLTRIASIIAVLTVLTVMTAQVFFRYVLNSSLHWSEELSIWTMIWMVFIGSVVVMRNWEHVFIPTAILRLPERFRPLVIIVSKVAVLVFLTVILIYGIKVFNGQANAFSFNVGVSTKWAKLSIPVGAALMMLVVIAQILEDVRRYAAGDLGFFKNYGKHEP